ncbi:hypothetical protein [Bradyrhizobium manausense]|uniref:hypothetical protein n=1 Tax=Bradyrhizobium manausense TaxID=989370 RepID=UPI001BA48FFC|nr:hypothetical protein [Bradyrhizobium manausense]
MPLKYGNASTSSRPKRDLLENKTIDADVRLRVDYDPIRMRYCKATSNATVDRDVGASHDAPETMF